MGVLGTFFGCRGDSGFNGRCSGASIGDGGFNGCCSGGRSGVVGFKVATLSLLLREKVRPARSQWLKIGVFTLAGRTFRGNAAEGAVLGEFFRANRPCAQVL